MPTTTFAAGDHLFRAGDPSDRAYLIEAGSVEILAGPADAPLRVALLGPGDVCGEMGLIEERSRSFSARATVETAASAVTRAEFDQLLANDPARVRGYILSLFERLRVLTARLESMQTAAAAPVAALPTPPPAARVVIHPLTRKAAETLPDEGLLVTKFPFRVGRAAEANERDGTALNDLWLLDVKPFNVSRNHLSIDLADDGTPVVRDRGSYLGVYVNEDHVGGPSPHRYAKLHDGDNTLVVGSRSSPYQFRVHVG